MALPRVERERLLHGNWKIRPAAGLYFNRAWCQVVDAVPAGLAVKRGWDLAATPKTEANDPGLDGRRASSAAAPTAATSCSIAGACAARPPPSSACSPTPPPRTAESVEIALPQDPGQAGKSQAARPGPRPRRLHRPRHPRERRQGHPLRPVLAPRPKPATSTSCAPPGTKPGSPPWRASPPPPTTTTPTPPAARSAPHQTQMASAGFLELARADLAARAAAEH